MRTLVSNIKTKTLKAILFLLAITTIATDGLLEQGTHMYLTLVFSGIGLIVFGTLIYRDKEIKDPEKKVFSKQRLVVFYVAIATTLLLAFLSYLGAWPFAT